jgi:hypothetical protein
MQKILGLITEEEMQMALDYEKEKLNTKSFGRHKE